MDGEATSYIDYPAKSSYRICFIQNIASDRGIFHYAASDHDDIFCGVCQFLYDQIHHLPQGGIFVLEKLGYAEEKGGGLVRRESLPSKEEQRNFGKENTALFRRDWR